MSSLTCVLGRQGGGRLPASAPGLKHLQPAAHHGWRTVLRRIHAGKRLLSPAAVVVKIETLPRCFFVGIRSQDGHLSKVLTLHQERSTLTTDGHYYSSNGNALRVDRLGTWFNLITRYNRARKSVQNERRLQAVLVTRATVVVVPWTIVARADGI